ncbi:DUF4190 domain-containing protein [Pseudonocardia endophytica]|uniref:DUF4190 domain-containing protein n=1 Tax=Pseudonocardia endophytica TaxID=401976 RepID=A0A4R1HHG9_PSEEN|nr:DUF4190 domain-containing protein [Pseudonocardia endophytica]TCK19885.1 hypothetical protein EV378_3829 [Pseudonocardia endophytica]
MTSTTERPVAPWPTRREREGGPARRPISVSRPAAYMPRHAVADVTERLPIVIPAQRSAEARPATSATPHPAPWRPTHAPRPPRPAVGSAVHDVRPVTGTARDGLGIAAVCLGAVGLPFGLVPVTGFMAAGLGVLALAFGIAGWSRFRAGLVSKRGAAVTGAVLGLIALGIGVAGTVAFVRAPDRLTYDLNSISTSWSGATAVTPAGE